MGFALLLSTEWHGGLSPSWKGKKNNLRHIISFVHIGLSELNGSPNLRVATSGLCLGSSSKKVEGLRVELLVDVCHTHWSIVRADLHQCLQCCTFDMVPGISSNLLSPRRSRFFVTTSPLTKKMRSDAADDAWPARYLRCGMETCGYMRKLFCHHPRGPPTTLSVSSTTSSHFFRAPIRALIPRVWPELPCFQGVHKSKRYMLCTPCTSTVCGASWGPCCCCSCK